ncbi:hypothetical protein [Mammaliicoccus stepanovicii]|uniref:hypothetical protein n=2 Tax=Mammaliicoccus stepanovicii TaxID=643214 RepID=UPI001E31CE29|nr:hypothetical protein [Mammaliicoccus stepanovicii]
MQMIMTKIIEMILNPSGTKNLMITMDRIYRGSKTKVSFLKILCLLTLKLGIINKSNEKETLYATKDIQSILLLKSHCTKMIINNVNNRLEKP